MSHSHDQALADFLAGLSDAEIEHLAAMAESMNDGEPDTEPDNDADEKAGGAGV